MKKLVAWPLLLFMVIILSGCFQPRCLPPEKEGQPCELVTKKLTLDLSAEGSAAAVRISYDVMARMAGDCDSPECLLAVPATLLVVPVGSFIVSGSIVVGGNVIHWVECSCNATT